MFTKSRLFGLRWMRIRDADASGASSLATSASTCSEFSEFSPLSEESVRRIAASCTKSCALDPLISSTVLLFG